MEWTDKVVLITGASSGIGAATAIHFSKLGAKLALVARNETHLRKVSLYCDKLGKGGKPFTITADVTEDSDVAAILQETVQYFGKLDVLVNNAGVIAMGGVKNSTMQDYDKVMATNMRAVYHLTMLATPHLVKSKGCIVNVSCSASTKPSTMAIAYSVSKVALDHFTKCVALELAPDGVRVNSICPGFVRTNLLKNTGLSEDQYELFVKNVIGKIPLKAPVETDQVASLIAFLASDQTKGITGSNYVIDGGSSLC